MTTERRIGPVELRLYLVAVLGVVYTIAWRAIGGHAPTEDAPVVEPPSATTVWIDELPPGARPVIAMPPGWHRATEASPATQPARVVRVVRSPRVRTRSS